MRNLTEHNVTDAFLARLSKDADPRFRQIITGLVTHLHDFAREVDLTPEELLVGARFIQAVGQISDERREEGVLLSDVLGLTMLVDAMAHRKPGGATESSVLGPFWRDGAKVLGAKGDISVNTEGEKAVVSGRVVTPDGKPVEGAILDFWQTAPNGLYESQDADQPDMNLRGKLETGADGIYELITVKPCSYQVPTDGPVGQILRAMGRHAWRPAHLHVIVSADGYIPVTTMLFDETDTYLDEDAVFGVKDTLVVRFEENTSGQDAEAHGVPAPFFQVEYDFGLMPAA